MYGSWTRRSVTYHQSVRILFFLPPKCTNFGFFTTKMYKFCFFLRKCTNIGASTDVPDVPRRTSVGATTSGSPSKNSRCYLKLILCCILPSSCPCTKFHPNGTKTIEVKMISYQSALVGWSGQSKNSCIHFKLILFEF